MDRQRAYIRCVSVKVRRNLFVWALAAFASLSSVPVHAQSTSSGSLPPADEAPIAMLVDLTSGQVLHARNPDRRFVPASITKVMTVFLAFELMEEGRISPGQVMTIRPDTWQEWAGKGSTMFLPADARVMVGELLLGIANVSANDASVVLAEGQAGSVAAWTAAMNAKAREIGMTNSRFGTPNGWPDGGHTFTSARDLIALANAMTRRHPERFAQYVGRNQYTYNDITQPNHDPLLGRVSGADGIKTGFTNEAGFGYLGTAKRDGRRLALVVAGVDRSSLRARLARDYIEWGFEAFEPRTLFPIGAIVSEARVQGGADRHVGLIADHAIYANLPIGEDRPMTARVLYDGPIRAPIEQGERIATLEITVPGMDTAKVPLFAERAVGKAGLFDRIVNGIAGWFV